MNYLRIILLFPFSAIYWLVTGIRNSLYDRGKFKSTSFNLPIIGVGNLSAGGTGKTPMVEYLIRLLLEHNYKIAVLSRGYKRKIKGYLRSSHHSTSDDIGDEAYQVKRKFSKVSVAVCEDRAAGINQLLNDVRGLQLIILDDSFQHRAVHPGLNILLTEFGRPFFKDFILPSGYLRESRNGYCRADIIIVTKCPDYLKPETAAGYTIKIRPSINQHLFFSKLTYQSIKPFNNFPETDKIENQMGEYAVLLFTGIGNPRPIESFIQENFKELVCVKFSDHHNFDRKDFESISKKFSEMPNPKKIILTTEKDVSRIENSEMETFFRTLPLYFLPIETSFNFAGDFLSENNLFDKNILDYVGKNQ